MFLGRHILCEQRSGQCRECGAAVYRVLTGNVEHGAFKDRTWHAVEIPAHSRPASSGWVPHSCLAVRVGFKAKL